MLRICILSVIVMLTALTGSGTAQVVVGSNLSFGPDSTLPPANYFASIQQYPEQNYTGLWFQYTGCVTSGCSLKSTGTLLDEGSDWYMVHFGDVFTKDAVHAGAFPTLTDKSGSPTRTIPVGDFYLGVRTGRGGGYYPGLPPELTPEDEWDIYGWVQLRNTGTQLQMISNAVAYASQGIVIGTTQVVPEPRSMALPFVASLLGASRLRSRRITKSPYRRV